MASNFDTYLRMLRETPIDEHTEHTGRSALEALLNDFAPKSGGQRTNVQHEPKRVADKGAPDFKVTRQGMILGYIETKQIGENLDKVLKSEQIARYKSLSHNIILTDYLHFIWINKDSVQRETLCHATDLENPKFRLKADRVAAVAKLLEGFFSSAPEGIGRAQQLALALATRSKLLKNYLGEELVRQERDHKEGPLWQFHIGGYQVLDKYLKSRKGRILSLDEINQVSAIADSLAFTIDQMAAIDAAYRSAFPEQA